MCSEVFSYYSGEERYGVSKIRWVERGICGIMNARIKCSVAAAKRSLKHASTSSHVIMNARIKCSVAAAKRSLKHASTSSHVIMNARIKCSVAAAKRSLKHASTSSHAVMHIFMVRIKI